LRREAGETVQVLRWNSLRGNQRQRANLLLISRVACEAVWSASEVQTKGQALLVGRAAARGKCLPRVKDFLVCKGNRSPEGATIHSP
jgi:hypothetical protein